MSSDAVPSPKTRNRPICFNFEIPCEDCIQPVIFDDIPDYFVVGENIQVNYSVLKTFKPKSGDWIGLFKCCHDIEKCFEFAGFKWAQKKSTYKYKPLSRSVVFYPEEIDVKSISRDKYIFLYLTTNERIIGQSSLFRFKELPCTTTREHYLELPFQHYHKVETKEKQIRSEDLEEKRSQDEKEPILIAEDKIEIVEKSSIEFRPELFPKPWNKVHAFKKMGKSIIAETEESKIRENIIKEVNSKEDTMKTNSRINEETAIDAGTTDAATKSTATLRHVPDMVNIFEKLIKQETALVDRVNKIEMKNEEFINTQKNIQGQILQYMKNIEALSQPQNSSLVKNQPREKQINKPKRRLPKILRDALNHPKNVHYYFPKEDVKDTFSGSEMTFKYLFNEIKQQEKLLLKPSDDDFEEDEPKPEKTNTTEVRKAATDITNLLKKLINHVEDSATSKKMVTSISLQDNMKHENKTINFNDFSELLKKKKSLQMSVQPKNENTYSGSNIAIDLLFNEENIRIEDDDINTKNEAVHNEEEKKNCSLKVTLDNKQDLNQSILEMTLKDFFVGICDNETVFLDICKDNKYDRQKKGKSPKVKDAEFEENNKDEINLENVLATTSDVVQQFKNRSLSKKLLTSSSYPSENRENSAICQRIQKLKEKIFTTPKNDEAKTTSDDGKISNASMAVQIGSAEETSAAILSSTPAVTRLTLLDSYEILSSSRQDEFDYNRSVKQDHTTKLILIKNILESNMTDEEKILSIEELSVTYPSKTKKQIREFKFRQWPKKNKRSLVDRKVKTEHETSDTSAESYKTDELTTASFPNPVINIEFKSKKKSKKLKKNKYGRNKFTQTTDSTVAKVETQTSESSLDDNSNFPKLVRKPLPSSIIPILLSDSKNSIHASSEEDFKTKPILKKKASPLPQLTKECSHNARKTSVTFLVDASIQCETSDFFGKDENHESINYKVLTPLYIDKTSADSRSNQTDTSNEDEPQGHKRERKVSFNTIILTSLFDNEEGEKDDQKGINVKSIKLPSGKSTWPAKDTTDQKLKQIPPVHQFLDFIEKEVKNVSDNTTLLQNSLNKAMRIFKAEAVMLKDKSAEVLTKAIRAVSPNRIPLQRKESPANIEIKLTSVSPLSENKNRISRSRSNEPRLSQKSSPRKMYETDNLATENLVEFVKKDKPSFDSIDIDDSNDQQISPIKVDKDLDYLNKEIELQKFLQNFLKQIKTLTDKESLERDVNKLSEKRSTEAILTKSIENEKKSNEDNVQVRKTISDSLKVPQYYWDISPTKERKREDDGNLTKDSSNISIINNNPETPVVSLYSQSDCYKSSYTAGTQSLINSFCPTANHRADRHRVSGMMLLQSFDSTISNIVKLYNNFTNYAFSTVTNHALPILKPKDLKDVNLLSGIAINNEENKFINLDINCPNPSRSSSSVSDDAKQPIEDVDRKPSYDYDDDDDDDNDHNVKAELKTNISLPMSFSNSDEDAKKYDSPVDEKADNEVIESLFKDGQENNTAPAPDQKLDPSTQDKSEDGTVVGTSDDGNGKDLIENPELTAQIETIPATEEVESESSNISEEKSKEFCLTCSDEFPQLKNTIELIKIRDNSKRDRTNSGSGKRYKKKKD